MNKTDLLARIDKIFRANTVERFVETGQFGQGHNVKAIDNIEELKGDIKNLISDEFNVGKIDKRDVFIGGRKLGGSYHISEPYEVAKKWGYKYLEFNDQIFKIGKDSEIEDTGLTWGEL
jgi:hypothetical protein